MNTQERILLWSSNLWQFGSGLLGPLFAIFATEIGGDILNITAAWAIYMIITGILTMYVGRIGDKIGHERLMISGYVLNALLTFGYLFVSSPVHLFIVQAGLGIALALSNPTWLALYDKYSTEKNDGYTWGSAYGHGNIATGLAALLGGFIVSYFSFTTLFVTMGIIQIFATILLLRMFRRKQQ